MNSIKSFWERMKKEFIKLQMVAFLEMKFKLQV